MDRSSLVEVANALEELPRGGALEPESVNPAAAARGVQVAPEPLRQLDVDVVEVNRDDALEQLGATPSLSRRRGSGSPPGGGRGQLVAAALGRGRGVEGLADRGRGPPSSPCGAPW